MASVTNALKLNDFISSLNGDRRGGSGNTLLHSAKLIIIEEMVEIISAEKITNRF